MSDTTFRENDQGFIIESYYYDEVEEGPVSGTIAGQVFQHCKDTPGIECIEEILKLTPITVDNKIPDCDKEAGDYPSSSFLVLEINNHEFYMYKDLGNVIVIDSVSTELHMESLEDLAKFVSKKPIQVKSARKV